MDKALKQRLVGATILIGLAIIFLPMLLDGENRSGTATQPIEVPQRPDVEFKTRRLPIGDQAGEQPEAQPEPRPAGADPERAVTPVPDKPADVQIGTVEQPVSSSRDAGELPPAEEPVAAPQATLAGAEAIPTATEPPAAGDWLVQVGSFGSLDNANRLGERLTGLGYPALLEATAPDSDLIRVKIGPFATESAATAAAQTVRGAIAGVNPSVINNASGSAVPAPAETGWIVQIGQFAAADNAASQKAALEQQGFAVLTDRLETGGSVVWRVRTRAVPDRDEAQQLRDRIEARSGVAGYVKNLAEQ